MHCKDVTFDMRGKGYDESVATANVGDLLWNLKSGTGHVLVAEVPCGTELDNGTADCGCGGWGIQPCPSTTRLCACGRDDSWRDHHYIVLRRGGL